MKRYYNLLHEAGVRLDPNVDWLRAMDWLMVTVDRIHIRSSGQKEFLLAMSGLLSGIRATQGINTSLNMTYIYVVKQCVDRLLGGNII